MSSGPVIVTGAAGFIGSHLAAALVRDGRSVIGVDNFDGFYDRDVKERNLLEISEVDPPSAGFRLIEADIRDRRAMAALLSEHRPATVIHLAALAGVRPSIAEPARFTHVNINGLTSVLDAMRETGCRRMLFASSSSVYGNNSKIPFAETDSVSGPISPYAATKRAGELLCHAYHRIFDLEIACLRFFTVYGPRQRPDLAIAKFMTLMATGSPVPMFGDGSSSRDYTFIDDIVGGVLAAERAIGSDSVGDYRIWNLGGSAPTTLADLIAAIGVVLGVEPTIEKGSMQRGDVDRTFADLTRSEAELGYRPTTPLEDGLRRQWEAMRAD